MTLRYDVTRFQTGPSDHMEIEMDYALRSFRKGA